MMTRDLARSLGAAACSAAATAPWPQRADARALVDAGKLDEAISVARVAAATDRPPCSARCS